MCLKKVFSRKQHTLSATDQHGNSVHGGKCPSSDCTRSLKSLLEAEYSILSVLVLSRDSSTLCIKGAMEDGRAVDEGMAHSRPGWVTFPATAPFPLNLNAPSKHEDGKSQSSRCRRRHRVKVQTNSLSADAKCGHKPQVHYQSISPSAHQLISPSAISQLWTGQGLYHTK